MTGKQQPRWLSADEQSAWRAYLEMTRLVSAHLERSLHRACGITHAHYEILVRLSEAPERTLRMHDLADASASSRSRLSHAAARLVELGWISRHGCETDRRGTYAVLTEAGSQALLDAAPHHVADVRRVLFDQLSSEQVTQLDGICRTVLAGLPR